MIDQVCFSSQKNMCAPLTQRNKKCHTYSNVNSFMTEAVSI